MASTPPSRRHPAAVPGLRAVLLLLALSATAPWDVVRRAEGFDTVPKWLPNDGQVHDKITAEALDGLASPERIKTLNWSAARNDDPVNERFDDPRHHFDANKIDKSLEWVVGRMETAIADGSSADTNSGKLQSSLEAVGDLLHSIQDFYAHSNYIELLMKAGVDPETIEPIDWGKRPEGLKTGYYCRAEDGIWTGVMTRKGCIDQIHEANFDTAFADDKQRAALTGTADSYEGALAFATSAYDFLHYDINKDNSQKPQGRIVHPASKLTFFEIARRVAVKETRRQWKTLLDGLRKASGERAAAVVSAVSGMEIKVPAAADGDDLARIEEHPVPKGPDFWCFRYEKKGKQMIVHLVQDPGNNPFDKAHPKMAEDMGPLAEMGTTHADARKQAEETCEQHRAVSR